MHLPVILLLHIVILFLYNLTIQIYYLCKVVTSIQIMREISRKHEAFIS